MMSGSVFRHLTVVGPQLRRRGSGERSFRLCVCDCGSEVEVREDHLLAGRRVSCGGPECRYVEIWTSYRIEKQTWDRMISRCCNSSNRKFNHYGGRGISVCARWLDSFWAFLSDMGPRPDRASSIDRIDNDGNYEPGNCRWATRSEQARNTRNSVYVDHGGRRVLLCELCEERGLSLSLVYARLNLGWPLEDALTRPARQYRRRAL